ncbi:secreted RxLR effector peptide protein, putative [Phytophthora infestans T30-4]|uniref:RxLR effector protein PITG_06094 n=2 Tax=Phytophthora infestans TaxID=4787 RepID=RXLRF_PHYIT|nr:secreted RxLR effector peptide protein, putative [Phytophthora infestans T30-4]D0N6D9.1 RecName: Full=RxLR effector protein PITG_06094; Flags: Precursor [Phytophthora infestans T30-4]KAF4028019.1 RXLR domain-containing protein [Phytophthora infestans]EEY70630.1 secreted RxLR effector peptide protein, putative [Phytophthora infestans T30-4]KAF4131127.1 RXLR effector domain-containing protein [Phytophthora infestans]KAI9988728.1 hypothetical protein PInf_022190 [Phytophthora infestans]|eukprot:XP_002998284.1 secreted RxLR effector peptide protein, putative [Phytophthora infestans T30-4]
MRLSFILAATLTGLLACATASDSEKIIRISNEQVLSDRQLLDTVVNDNEKRFLRAYNDAEDDSEDPKNVKNTVDAKPADESEDSELSEEERFSLIQMSNQPRYYWWFQHEMTPRDVRRALGLRAGSIKLVKRSIYRGYVKYYNKHCSYYENRKKDFCKAKEY